MTKLSPMNAREIKVELHWLEYRFNYRNIDAK